MSNIIELHNVWFAPENFSNSSDTSNSYILKDISFSVKAGKILGISGESGSGKTTIAKIIAGILTATKGEIKTYFEMPEGYKSNPVQLLFQNHEEIINPYRKVKDILTEALKINRGKESDIKKPLKNLLSEIGITCELLGRRCRQLSGGERQRIALARLLALNPCVLILDEPFSAQDLESQMNLIKLLSEIKNNNSVTIICISHLKEVLNKVADDIIEIKNGQLITS